MTNIEFIDYIKTQEAYQELLEQYNPNIIYIGGSRANGHTKPGSDWDLVAVISDGCKGCKNFSIINDRLLNVHIMIFSIQNFISMLTDSINYGNNMHLMQFFMSGYTAYKNFNLYNDGKLVDFFTFLEDNKQKITELCIIQLLRRMRLQLKSIVINKNLNFDIKIYYNLLTAYDILNNTDSSLLIHKLRWKISYSEQELSDCFKRIEWLYNFIHTYQESSYDKIKAYLEGFLWNSEKNIYI